MKKRSHSPPSSRLIRSALPCPDELNCGSSDAYSTYSDGHGFCFSCRKVFDEEEDLTDLTSKDVKYDYIAHRSISKRSFQTYEAISKIVDNELFEVKFPFGPDAAKIRAPEKVNGKVQATCLGDFRAAGLFGQDIFDPGSKPSVTIFEGEYDAIAGYEMLLGTSACVSLKSGAQSAFNDLSRQDIYDYVNSFDKIYICFDNDKAGQEAVQSIQGLFDFRKVYHVKIQKYKDANEYLANGEFKEFKSTWESSKRFVPDNIISSFFDIEKALDEASDDQLGTYPFPDLQEMTYGLFSEEVVVVKAPEGVGKTEFFRALEFHLLKTTEYPIGIIHLEENNATTIKAIAGYELEVPAVLPDCGLSRQDILSAYKRAVRDDEGRVHIHSSFDVEDEAAFLGNIRFLVSAAGCRFIFLDHITWLATGGEDDDERRKLDRISQKLKLLAKELGFCLIMISHVNDDGKTRGSRNISKVANTVISIHRDLEAGSTETEIVLEKVRLGGRTGPAGKGYFHRDKGMLRHDLPIIKLVRED